VAALQAATAAAAAVANCDYGGLYGHHLQQQQQQQPLLQYGNVGYYDGGSGGYHQLGHLQGYDEKPAAYDNNNKADVCDMNSAVTAASVAVAYDDPYATTTVSQLDRQSLTPQVCTRLILYLHTLWAATYPILLNAKSKNQQNSVPNQSLNLAHSK